jgi:dihydrofolate synthase/folylpolyglutamate synthase
MNYAQAVAYLTNATKFGSPAGSSTVTSLLARMGNPQCIVPAVHIAGTNGKGSVTANLASILTAAGFRVGRFTSPHLLDFRERIHMGDDDISEYDFARITTEIASHAATMIEAGERPPTFFELCTALAFRYFYERRCDIMVVETGLGGRFDATNTIPAPLAAVITPVAKDHCEHLGHTLTEITSEKAGIIKTGCRVISAPQMPEAAKVIREKCMAQKAELSCLHPHDIAEGDFDTNAQTFSVGSYKDLTTPLLGRHQIVNAALAVQTAAILSQKGFAVSETAIRQGLSQCRWPGRFEILQRKPWYAVVDGAHNPHSALFLYAALERYFPNRKIFFLMGVMQNKDFAQMLRYLAPSAERFFTVAPNSPHAVNAGELASFIQNNCGVHAQAYPSVQEAVDAARAILRNEDVLCAFGSLWYIGYVRQMFQQVPK